METGELLTRWTIRVALVLYIASVALRLTGKSGDLGRSRLARWFSTLGVAAYLAHVGCAFHFFHEWSHDAAYAATAKETEAHFGFHWGGGLYFNYVFTALWLLDVTWAWIAMESQPRWARYAVHGFLVFMAFQGTVVFETGLVRWLGVSAACILLTLWIRHHTRR